MEFYLTMDQKRRIAIPTKCRKDLSKSVVIRRGLDGCLDVHAKRVWEEGKTKSQILSKRLSINEKHRRLGRFLTTVEEMDVDGSGRIVIPEHLCQFADLTETIVFVGTEEGFQIWSAEAWGSSGMPELKEIQELAESDEFQQLSNPTA